MKDADTFSTIEDTQAFLSVLSETINEVLDDAQRELSESTALRDWENVEVWQLVLYTTTKLSSTIANSRKLMKDLETLKKILDRSSIADETETVETAVTAQLQIVAV